MPETADYPFSDGFGLRCAVGALRERDAWRRSIRGRRRRKGPRSNPMCPRLEAQLATIDRVVAAATRPKRSKSAAIRMGGQAAKRLDRVTRSAKRMGCGRSGFFSLFSGQSAQCGPVNNQIQTCAPIWNKLHQPRAAA